VTRSWLDLPSHLAWLDAEGARLLDFARRAALPSGGFGWLDERGRPREDRGVETWITARMTHVFAVADLRGVPGAGPLADHGVAALRGPLRDHDHDGWFGAIDRSGHPTDAAKSGYQHAFVVLAASSAVSAGRPGAQGLLADALGVVARRFWRDDEEACVESWDRAWTTCEAYRGANSNMHFVEAFLAAADVTRDDTWRRRALAVATRLIHGHARANDWRLPEHYDEAWRPLLGYNADRPADPFRPYGSTIGHWLEWSRLLVSLDAALAEAPAWLVADARRLFDRAVKEGWSVDGAPGFVYTVDWTGRPVNRARMHWVVAEGIAAAAALLRRCGDSEYDRWYREWWDAAGTWFVDRDGGSWWHELAPDNIPASGTWAGKPDVYHAYQATLLPQLSPAPTLATALRQFANGP
jgi:sulfoquinovose isomerase